jgi:phosphatidylglycerol:prolipoprotein diacylglycerol transferase
MFPVLQLGPLALQLPGLILLTGLWIGLVLSERRAHRHAENPSHLYNLAFTMLIAGVIGARLAYAVAYPNAFFTNFLNLVSLNPGLLDPFAGGLIAALAGAIYIYRKHLPFWTIMDTLTPLFALMAIAIGVSHFSSGSAYGELTNLPWGIHLWGATRHPTQIYEIIFATITMVVVILLDKTSVSQIPGTIFLTFLSLTAVSRLFLEAFRGDSLVVANGFRLAQVIAWLILAICLAIFGWRILHSNQKQGVD